MFVCLLYTNQVVRLEQEPQGDGCYVIGKGLGILSV